MTHQNDDKLDALTSDGRFDADMARRFMALAIEESSLLRYVRRVPMAGARERYIEDMRSNPKDSAGYIQGLAGCAGVKLRKARVFLGLDHGTITPKARSLLDAALETITIVERAELPSQGGA